MRAVAAAEAALADTDLDYELMLLVGRSTELAGTRGGSAYTLRFTADGLDLLVRVAPNDGGTRVDGWIVPPVPVTVQAAQVDGERTWDTEVGLEGRFEFAELPNGLYRLWLNPTDSTDEGLKPFGTPAFEI
jgi:hypothetical protein